MKKLLLTIAILFICLTSLRSIASEFTLRLSDNGIFDLNFDAAVYKDIKGVISLENVMPGKHYIKVFKYRFLPNGFIMGMPSLAFEGYIRIRSGRALFAMIDRYGRYVIEQDLALSPPPYYPPAPPVYYPAYMNDRDFSDFKASLNRLSFESSKLTLAEQVLSSNTLTSAQVLEIMELFTFESSKLSFAKSAYLRVYDPNRFYIVNNAFTFSSSISSLDSYIASFN